MNTNWKPPGYTSVAPYLVVNGAQRLLDFLVEVFDAEPLRRYDGPDGKLVHAEARVDDTVVMFADAAGDYQPMPVNVHVYVSDVDAVFQKAVRAGGTVVQEPKQQDDPDKRGGVTDPTGITWWIASQVS
ncbi:MAG TPA: VOC family protein [Longimicrobiales bacterium]|nr:VOC family protein [Longimicrobiales bacterium]